MTEKDFIQESVNAYGLHTAVSSIVYPGALRAVAQKAVELAKAQGAKFDPEPVNLPALEKKGRGSRGFVGAKDRAVPVLTTEECQEVIRRCDVVSKLKAYIVSLGLSQAGLSCYHLLKWLDGTLPVPDEASTDQKTTYDSGWIEDPDGERSFRITSRP